jgi:hypothetical protein
MMRRWERKRWSDEQGWELVERVGVDVQHPQRVHCREGGAEILGRGID